MEGGLSASFEKFVIDCEMLQQIIYTQRPIKVDASTLALDAIAEVGPHGHFFGCDHTQQRYRDAFYMPLLSDWRNYETWVNDGCVGRTNVRKNSIKRCLPNMLPHQWLTDTATSLRMLLRAEKQKAAHRQIFRKSAAVLLEKRAFIQRPLKHLRINITARGNRNNRVCPFWVLAC